MWLSFLFNFIISCHLLIPSLLTQLFHHLLPVRRRHHSRWRRGDGRATNLIKVICTTDATCVVRSPDNYLQHRPGYTKQERCGAFLQEPRGGGAKTYHQSNFPPGPPTKQSVWGNTCIIHLFAETAMGEHRRAEQEARRLPAVGRRGQRRGRFSQFVLLSKQCPSEPIGLLHAHLSVGQSTAPSFSFKKHRASKKKKKSVTSVLTFALSSLVSVFMVMCEDQTIVEVRPTFCFISHMFQITI